MNNGKKESSHKTLVQTKKYFYIIISSYGVISLFKKII